MDKETARLLEKLLLAGLFVLAVLYATPGVALGSLILLFFFW